MSQPPLQINCTSSAPRADEQQGLSQALARGELVAIPTETVYGLAARADSPEAIRRLRELKGYQDQRPFTWHLGTPPLASKNDGLKHSSPYTATVPSLGDPRLEPRPLDAIVRRLTNRYWPGPLTLVVQGVPAAMRAVAEGDWIGLRQPAHPATGLILHSLPFPVVATSANRAGQAPLLTAQAVIAEFGSDLAAVVDGGASCLNEASAVLRVGRGHFDLLREGLVTESDLRSSAGLAMAFVCTGNTCRSPMAEGLARAATRRALGEIDPASFGFEFHSMGVFASPGSPPSVHSVAAMNARGIDISDHHSTPTSPENLIGMDRIYCLTRSHAEALLASLPRAMGSKVELLDPLGKDIPDPIGGSESDYELCARSIDQAIAAHIAEWVGK